MEFHTAVLNFASFIAIKFWTEKHNLNR